MEIEKFTDEDGNFFQRRRYKGNNFHVYYNSDIEERLTNIFPKFKCYEGDAIVCTFPKSGTHWFYNMVAMLKKGNTDYKGSPHLLGYHTPEKFEELPHPRVYGSHLRYEILPESIKKSNDIKIINLVRNPKDVLVSYYEFILGTSKTDYAGNFNGFFELFLKEDFWFDGWFNYVKSWDRALKTSTPGKMLRMAYEEAQHNLEGVIKKLDTFLGTERDEAFLQKVKENVSFEHLKKEHRDEFQNVGGNLTHFMKDGVLPVYRKGRIGDWKNYFTVAQNEKFEKVYEEQLKGYEDIPVQFS